LAEADIGLPSAGFRPYESARLRRTLPPIEQGANMRRREFLGMLGGSAAAWSVVARAQQLPVAPMIGFLGGQSPDTMAHVLSSFWRGLGELGFVEGKNVSIEYRWAEDRNDRLSAMAAELVQDKVAVIVASGGNVSALAAKAATATIPIVFPVVTDPVKGGLVESFNRPGGNVTGIAMLTIELDAKRMELLREMMPTASVIGALMDSSRPEAADQLKSVQAAAQAVGRQLAVATASNEGEFDAAFASLVKQGAGALLVAASPLFTSRRDHLVALAARHLMPTMFQFREFAAAGGLVSYGASVVEAYRQAGVYVGRILKGEKPADLPVMRPVKFEFVINLQTAKTLGITIPETMLATADEVIQ
jgi:putative tryptophan/tyrosine transport system substrate-binding protein